MSANELFFVFYVGITAYFVAMEKNIFITIFFLISVLALILLLFKDEDNGGKENKEDKEDRKEINDTIKRKRKFKKKTKEITIKI